MNPGGNPSEPPGTKFTLCSRVPIALSHPPSRTFISPRQPTVCGDCMRRMELDPLLLRWKKTTRALKIHEQHYGKYITDILERRTDAELALFKDPVEAAAFFCLVDVVMRSFDKNSPGLSSLLPVTRQQSIIADIPAG
jgi:hypothetical protein